MDSCAHVPLPSILGCPFAFHTRSMVLRQWLVHRKQRKYAHIAGIEPSIYAPCLGALMDGLLSILVPIPFPLRLLAAYPSRPCPYMTWRDSYVSHHRMAWVSRHYKIGSVSSGFHGLIRGLPN